MQMDATLYFGECSAIGVPGTYIAANEVDLQSTVLHQLGAGHPIYLVGLLTEKFVGLGAAIDVFASLTLSSAAAGTDKEVLKVLLGTALRVNSTLGKPFMIGVLPEILPYGATPVYLRYANAKVTFATDTSSAGKMKFWLSGEIGSPVSLA